MAMSMKDLLHSDDEDISPSKKDGDSLKPKANDSPSDVIKKGSPVETRQSLESPSSQKEHITLKSRFAKRLSSRFEKEPVKKTSNIIDNPASEKGMMTSSSTSLSNYFKGEDGGTKAGWIKDKVAGSFNKLATTKTYSSVDVSLESPEEPKRLSKAQSEIDLKSSGTTHVDGVSKGKWLKEHLSLYLTKPKANVNGLDTPGENITSVLEQQNGDETESDTKSDKPSIMVTSAGSAKKTTTLATVSYSNDENHLPLYGPSDSPIVHNGHLGNVASLDVVLTNSKTNKAVDSKKFTKSPIEVISSSRSVKTNISLSGLLHSQRSPTEEGPQLNIVKGSLSPGSIMKKDEGTEDKQSMTEQELEVLTEEILKEDLKTHFKPTDIYPITFTQLWYMTLAMFCYIQYDLPPYLEGYLTGALWMYLIGCALIWFFSSSAESTLEYKRDLKFLFKRETDNNKSAIFKTLPRPETLQKPRTLKIWMSLALQYNDEFEKDKTREIYTVVYDSTLHLFLSKPRPEENTNSRTRSRLKKQLKRETKKAAMERVQREKALFAFEWHYVIQLDKCSAYLKPDDLPIRRIWNKKYPIKLCVSGDAITKRKIDTTLEDLTLRMTDILNGSDELESDTSVSNGSEDEEFYLFSNAGREKEDFFYRIQLCIKPLKHQVSFDDIKYKRVSTRPNESYPHYMVDLMTESERVMQRNIKGKKMEPHLAWLNIFIGRAFWDFWHESYWIDKLHQKIQTRLTKLNTPPFITSITLKDMNCGHNVPIIHKGAVPTLDDNGVWTDLQITYKGYFTLTLETYLNVDYYVGVVSGIVKQKAGVDPKSHAQLSKLTKLSEIHDVDDNVDSGSSVTSFPSDLNETFGEDEAAQIHDELHEMYMGGMDQTDGLDEEVDPFLSDPRTKAFLESNAGKKVVGVVVWLAKSKIAKRVAETDFARKAYERAYEKFRKMPIILRVEIQNVKGNLAVNLPPPPSNRLWFGFRGNPVIFISATPKVGEKQVRLTYLTNWIERKLKEEFKKYLVLPSMQDISIKIMDSQLKELNPERPMS